MTSGKTDEAAKEAQEKHTAVTDYGKTVLGNFNTTVESGNW
jgi:hypothetical protein